MTRCCFMWECIHDNTNLFRRTAKLGMQGIAIQFSLLGTVSHRDILEGTYCPAASIYTLPEQIDGATLTFNFGGFMCIFLADWTLSNIYIWECFFQLKKSEWEEWKQMGPSFPSRCWAEQAWHVQAVDNGINVQCGERWNASTQSTSH